MIPRLCVLLGTILIAVGCWWALGAFAQAPQAAQWIWFDEGNPLADAPAEVRYFRRTFTIEGPKAHDGLLEITADNGFVVWVNGVEVGSGNDWHFVESIPVGKHLVGGRNVIAVEARNEGGPAGLLFRLSYGPKGQPKKVIVSDRSWKSGKAAAKGWVKTDFDDSKWRAARELAPAGSGPWGDVNWGGAKTSRPPRFSVPEGFVVEQAVEPPETDRNFSLVNMTFDARGRLLVSRENGPVLLCTDPDDKGVCRSVRPYCKKVTNCQGMCWVDEALMLVGDGPQGTGLYRCRDTKKADVVDHVALLHRFDGGMGEHGPHAVLHGPDDYLYVVLGNHSWAHLGGPGPSPPALAANSPLMRWPTGGMGPDQGKPGSTEDVLLPRENDANGHAANILAPGGTIWRLNKSGKEIALVAAGFRNQFDAAFSPAGELFTFDSDMEWDEGLPWYRPVRICHCPPGADLGWRTGSANLPPYAIDTLPAIYDTGRGSPVGLEFYDHFAFPEKYRGAYFMADWSLGIIYAVHLRRDGATYKAEVEKFCTGAPMPVTDLAVAPDGSLVFTMGGRGTQGGVYRIRPKSPFAGPSTNAVVDMPQPLAAWSRAKWVPKVAEAAAAAELEAIAGDLGQPKRQRITAITMLGGAGRGLKSETRGRLIVGLDPDVAAQAVWALGLSNAPEARELLVMALRDADAFVQRRACEALVRRGLEPPVSEVWRLLHDKDRFVRTAARLVLQRINPRKWVARLSDREGKTDNRRPVLEGIIALCKTGHAAEHSETIFAALATVSTSDSGELLLGWLRTTQLALFHTTERPVTLRTIADRCWGMFPHADPYVNRELAILLTWFRKEGILRAAVHARLLQALEAATGDRPQQVHYFYCLRLLKDDWTANEKARLLNWFEGTKTWSGGASYNGFLENILRDAAPIFTAGDMAELIARAEKLPRATGVLLRTLPEKQLPPISQLTELYGRLVRVIDPHVNQLRSAILGAAGRLATPEAHDFLRRTMDSDAAQQETIIRELLRFPTTENFASILRGLDSSNKQLVLEVIQTLQRSSTKPKPDDPATFRSLLLAARRLDPNNRWNVVQLLRHWSSGRQFGADEGQWEPELAAWSKWFGQNFPKEPTLPDVAAERPAEPKYKFDELLAYLQGPGRNGNHARGRAVFEKAQCIKCHKYGKEGEGIGPDLTTLSKRFKRTDVLESILFPSRVISDQYRSTLILTKKGQQYTGLMAVQGDRVTVLMSDGTKVVLKKGDIDQQFASLVSVMPEQLLDPLSKAEIADLFAFLESEPKK
jgi:putative heme-binding domain-containing protein